MKKIGWGLLAVLALAACAEREVVKNKQSGVPVEAKAVVTPLAAVTVVPTAVPTMAAAAADDAGLGTLKITDQEIGTGSEAIAGHNVTVHYTGRLLTGKKFDSSLDRGQPFTFKLGGGQVIKGWDQGVAGMKVGGKRQLVIPPSMGYGSQDMGVIPPNSTLVFDVELLGVE